MKKKDLPKDTQEISYILENKQVITELTYDCGCVWTVEWEDITKGKVLDMSNDCFCEEHDPTLPWVEEWDNEKKEWIHEN